MSWFRQSEFWMRGQRTCYVKSKFLISCPQYVFSTEGKKIFCCQLLNFWLGRANLIIESAGIFKYVICPIAPNQHLFKKQLLLSSGMAVLPGCQCKVVYQEGTLTVSPASFLHSQRPLPDFREALAKQALEESLIWLQCPLACVILLGFDHYGSCVNLSTAVSARCSK